MKRSPTRSLHALIFGALADLLLAGPARAHDDGTDDGGPAERGLQLDAAVGLAAVDGKHPVPGPMPPGVIGTGVPPEDLRDHPLEHGALGLRGRVDAQWSAALGWGWHGTDPAHVEDAWLQWQPQAQPGRWLRLGRQSVGRGAVIGRAGHLDRFLLAPFAVRAAFDGDWIEDGLQGRWKTDAAADEGFMPSTFEAGLWRAQRFPASSAEPRAALHLHPQWMRGDWQIDAFVARLDARQRGTQLVASSGAHSHATPDCSAGLTQIACFDGRVLLGGASARWAPDELPWELQGAWILREERGNLATSNGQAETRSRYQGFWVDGVWRPSDSSYLGLRLETLSPSHRLEGPGAALVAADTGLDGTGRSHGLAVAGGWQLHPQWRVAVEAGRRRLADTGSQNHVAARLLWQARAVWP